MAKLPLVISVPHAGRDVPEELRALNLLSADEIAADGDEGAAELYRPLASEVLAFVTTPVARAFVDQDRAADDRGLDGVVKTHTCWQRQVYAQPLDDALVATLLERYYRPYHERLAAAAAGAALGIDCHTMSAFGPPIGPDAGERRPFICLGDGEGACPEEWSETLAEMLGEAYDEHVTVNQPFAGGYITRARPGGIPWLQLELRRGDPQRYSFKSRKLLGTLKRFCAQVLAAEP